MAKKFLTKRTGKDDSEPKIIIFCGGRGTRFNEETESKPKPLITVGEKPILWHIMKIFSHHGFSDFILPIGYKGEMIRQHFSNYSSSKKSATEFGINHPELIGLDGSREWRVKIIDTGLNTQTGGRLSRVRDYIDSEYFFLTYGDGVGNIDLKKLLAFHKKHGKIGTITGVHPIPRFGELSIKGDKVVKFSEKPQSLDTFVNGGFMVFDKRIFGYLKDNESLNFEQEPLKKLANDGELMVHKHEGFWHPMDTYRDWQKLNDFWCENKAPWKIWK